ncbi:MAG: DUF3991 and TOPRIM domain-containing protein [Gluconacetobacter sp.]
MRHLRNSSGLDKEDIRSQVRCAVVLENAGYALDKSGTTRRDAKYRRGKGETIIVRHEGRAWFDPGSDGRGDVFALYQHLHRVDFRTAIEEVAALKGIEAKGTEYVETLKPADDRSVGECWDGTRPVRPGSRVWTYLTQVRCLPAALVRCAIRQDIVREGGYGAAWFAHHDDDGRICGVEMRGPETRLCKANTVKTLFRFTPVRGRAPINRMVVTEAAIDALSCALLDRKVDECRSVYVSTAGGMGVATCAAITAWLEEVRHDPAAELVAAVDDDEAGDRFASRLACLAVPLGVRCTRMVPGNGAKDWNQAVQDIVAQHRQAA